MQYSARNQQQVNAEKFINFIISHQLLHSNSKYGTTFTINDELLTSAITILLAAVIAIVPVARILGLLIVHHWRATMQWIDITMIAYKLVYELPIILK